MNGYQHLLLNIDAGIARITLNRPAAGNALHLALAQELAHAVLVCEQQPSVKVVLLTGNGPMFCAGGDLKAMAGFGEQVGLGVRELADALHRSISRLSRMDAPVVVAVNGPAAGAGLGLAMAGDIVIAAPSASFTMAYTRAGLSPDGGATQILPRMVGLRRAQELALTNRTLSAQEALDWGMLTRVAQDGALLDEAMAICRQLAAGPKLAQGHVKKLLLCGQANSLEAQLELESRAIALAAEADDGREGIAAFSAKRKPQFR